HPRARRDLPPDARALQPGLLTRHDFLGPRGSRRHGRHRGHDVPGTDGGTLRGRVHLHGQNPLRHHASRAAGESRMSKQRAATLPPAAAPAGEARRTRFAGKLPRMLAIARGSIVVALVLVALLTHGFLSAPSLLALLTTLSFVGCVAAGMTLITISGNIMSFALGATAAASAVVFVAVLNRFGLAAGVGAALLAGALITGLQGFLVGWLRA